MMPTTTTTTTTTAPSLAEQSIKDFCTVLASKQATPGGGASAAISAAIGAATASMSAAYTQRSKDETSGAAAQARQLLVTMELPALLSMADDDVQAYQDLQSTWKNKDSNNNDLKSQDDIQHIQTRALEVPTLLVEACHARIRAVHDFLPHCNPNIASDAKVGIHQMAGAARAAYQTVLVNAPPAEEKQRLVQLLLDIQHIEMDVLQLES
jgi:formiminotetrahydrofolate cyclodeaminase